jgi:hypothetical protein
MNSFISRQIRKAGLPALLMFTFVWLGGCDGSSKEPPSLGQSVFIRVQKSGGPRLTNVLDIRTCVPTWISQKPTVLVTHQLVDFGPIERVRVELQKVDDTTWTGQCSVPPHCRETIVEGFLGMDASDELTTYFKHAEVDYSRAEQIVLDICKRVRAGDRTVLETMKHSTMLPEIARERWLVQLLRLATKDADPDRVARDIVEEDRRRKILDNWVVVDALLTLAIVSNSDRSKLGSKLLCGIIAEAFRPCELVERATTLSTILTFAEYRMVFESMSIARTAEGDSKTTDQLYWQVWLARAITRPKDGEQHPRWTDTALAGVTFNLTNRIKRKPVDEIPEWILRMWFSRQVVAYSEIITCRSCAADEIVSPAYLIAPYLPEFGTLPLGICGATAGRFVACGDTLMAALWYGMAHRALPSEHYHAKLARQYNGRELSTQDLDGIRLRLRTMGLRFGGDKGEHVPGDLIKSRTSAGATTVVVFSSPHCEPCERFVRECGAENNLKDVEIRVVAVGDWKTESPSERYSKYPGVIVVDAPAQWVFKLAIRGTPTVLVVDPTGRIRARFDGLPQMENVRSAIRLASVFS